MSNSKHYIKRLADSTLAARLRRSGAVLIEGAKWCGKTTTGRQHSQSAVYLQDPTDGQQNLRMAQLNPQLLLQGKAPLLIDEWQDAPLLWDAVRFEVDQRGLPGQFILTGSAVTPPQVAPAHSGTGRISRLRMQPMSLSESGEGNPDVSLSQLLAGEKIAAQSPLSVQDQVFLMCRGGWPSGLAYADQDALGLPFDYLESVCAADLSRADGVQRDPVAVKTLLRAYARHIGTSAPDTKLHADVQMQYALSLPSVRSYLDAMSRIFLIEEMPAWNPKLRSKTAIRTSRTRYFCDPSLMAAALKVGPQDLLADLETCGFMFENLVMRDLRVYAQCLEGELYHYRDANGLEADAVLHFRNGQYALIEVKMADAQADEAAKNLQKLESRIDTQAMKAPAFKLVITAGKWAYQRPDGVYVVPIGCLTV